MKELFKTNIPILKNSRILKISTFVPMNITCVKFTYKKIFHKAIFFFTLGQKVLNTVLLFIFFIKQYVISLILFLFIYYFLVHYIPKKIQQFYTSEIYFAPTSITGSNKGTLLLVNKNLNGKPVVMAQAFSSMSEFNLTQHLMFVLITL